MSNTKFHPCPVCSLPVKHFMRYPHEVCNDCYGKACDDQGRKLDFYTCSRKEGSEENVFKIGFGATVIESNEEYDSNICYINGVKCWADEARFGGIVIEAMIDGF
ncbi:hypothetical protein [Nostoc sp.]|uniref:hypothetical protein n=1 Tax=Nostoc sp. TaxID=1180 RepID=UPI002FF9DD9A